ncbi:MAG: 30S ribosome-binding factor RbfA [Clostridia bacterium]|nr:30S ribosome-binding factor RbfA [Clostridia bacterium]MBQ4637993.1 30S ribosome-binding factor RbfA [Clostridia bacterium]
MAGYSRTDRLSQQIKSDVYEIISQMKDPRIPEMFTITYANVTPDLRYAKIGISSMGSEEERRQMLKALKGAAGFVRREIGLRSDIRYIPEISFALDDSIEYSVRIHQKLQEIEKSETSDKGEENA